MKQNTRAAQVPAIILETSEPISGYWDGGRKSFFRFEPELHKDKKGYFVKWGSWAMNFYFTVGFGRSWKHAASIAAKWMQKRYARDVPYTIRVEWQENAGQFGNPD